MAFKINIADKSGKTYKLETEVEYLIDKELNQIIDGKEIREDLEGYEFEIAGASDKSGFTALESVEGVGLKRVLLTYGKGMHRKPKKEGKKKLSNSNPKGLRLRKTVRKTTQIKTEDKRAPVGPPSQQLQAKTFLPGIRRQTKKFQKQCQEPMKAKQTRHRS